jgi:hypothetical protein
MRVTNGIPLGSPLLLPVHTVICVQTLKDLAAYGSAQIQKTTMFDAIQICAQIANTTGLFNPGQMDSAVRAF